MISNYNNICLKLPYIVSVVSDKDHMILCEQALCDSGKEELSFNRKRAPVEPAPLTERSILCLTVASFCHCSC